MIPAPATRPVTPLGILAARLDELAARLGDLNSPSEIVAEAHDLARLAGGLDPYLGRSTTSESPALAALAARTQQFDWSAHENDLGLEQEMLSGHVEGQVLKMLVHATRARQVLEIGTFTGYATLAMAEALPADGRLVTCEVDAMVAAEARDTFAASTCGGVVEVRLGPARETLAALTDEGAVFDLVFLDADKAGYADYVDALLEGGLLAPYGLLCVDNTLMQGEPWMGPTTPNGRAITSFNERLGADNRVEQVVLPVRDGLTLVRRAGGAP